MTSKIIQNLDTTACFSISYRGPVYSSKTVWAWFYVSLIALKRFINSKQPQRQSPQPDINIYNSQKRDRNITGLR
ncbi:hypothetical protein LguiA_011087 [Lonicera macranthoides]